MTAKRAPLRAVGPNEKPARRRKPTTIAAAAELGRRDYLAMMRVRCSTAMDDPNTPARDLAALMRRASDLDKEIRALDAEAAEEAEADGVTPDEELDASAI